MHSPVPFRGPRQAGIITEAQDRMHFVTFDVTSTSRDDVVRMLREWTDMAERMTRGEEASGTALSDSTRTAPPRDTGEALGLPASQLTLTIGFGPSLFTKDGQDRFGDRRRNSPDRWRTCRSSRTRPWTPPVAEATSACRRAPTIPRSPCTPSATWPG